KPPAEKHEQFTSMTRIEAELAALAKRKEADRERRFAVDADERLGANEVAGRPEQRMAALDRAHLYPVDGIDRTPEDLRVDDLHSAAVGAKTPVADDQRERDRVDPEDQRPFLGDDVEQRVDAVGLD